MSGCRIVAIIGGTELFGHEKGNIECVKALRDAGALVTVGVTSLKNGGAVRETLVEDGFEVFDIPFGWQWSKTFFLRHPTLVFTNLWRVFRSSMALLRKCRSFEATHVQIGSPLIYSYLAPALWLNRIPLVYRAGDKPPSSDAHVNRFFWKRCMQRADAIVAISQFVQNNIVEIKPSVRTKVFKIYNRAPDWSSEAAVPDADGLRHIVYLGQIAENKGVSLLVEAARMLAAKHKDVVFDFVGGSAYSAEYENELRALVESSGLTSQIRFHGRNNEPITFMKSCILHVAPTLIQEGLGNVVLEAKAAGIPSVVFPTGGLPEMIIHGIDGYVCEGKTVDSLVDGISYFLDDEPRRLRCANAAKQSIDTRFGNDRFVDEWARVYNSVVKI